MAVRFRIEGELSERLVLPVHARDGCISRLKILAGMRTDEHTVPQDGRFSYTHDSADVDVRLSVMPTYHGENAVLRLLMPRDSSFEALGMPPELVTQIEFAMQRSGLVLLVGPTGSGKTTTLYAIVQMLVARGLSVSTIEDPIEYGMPDVRQVEAGARSGLTFATGLRALLRQDPDALMVGEIRDAETARLAAQAALTGHLVLSSLHAESATQAMPRLADLGIPPRTLAASLRLIIGQRLVRTDAGRIGVFEFLPYA